ncbi:MAG: glycosyltransferase family 39 protein [bacterium]|nr:glycosyltransferase family 39 protein [bacterium]
MYKKLLSIFILAFLIRLISLNQSLWLDEATTAKVVLNFNYLDIITKFSPFDFHPPLYYLFMKFWTSIVGYSEIVLRMPSVLFSVLTGFVIYKIGKLLKNEKAGFWAAVFFLLNPLIIYYSQEARMYSMVTFFVSCMIYFFIQSNRNFFDSELAHKKFAQTSTLFKNFNSPFLMLFFMCLSIMTFYGTIFIIIPLLLVLLYKKKYKQFIFALCFLIFDILLLSPLLIQQLIHAKQSMQIVLNWKAVLGTVSFKNLILIPLKFTTGRISFEPKVIYFIVSGIWSLMVWFYVIKGGLKKYILLFLLLCPLVLGLLFSIFSPLLQYFRFLYLIVPLSILLAIGVKSDGKKILFASGFVILSLIYLLIPFFHREDWKSLANGIPSNIPVYMIASSSDPLKYYRPDIQINEIRNINNLISNNIIVIPYTTDIYGFNYYQTLIKSGFVKKYQTTYRGLQMEAWSR